MPHSGDIRGSDEDLRRVYDQVFRHGPSAVAVNRPASGPPRAVFSGAFNPLHDAHRGMARLASELLDVPVDFEISIENVDKRPLAFEDVRRRVLQFPADQRVWLSRTATFLQKAEVFPGATFVVGADTMARLVMPRYYDGEPEAMHRALGQIADRRCRFLVFGRMIDDRFCGLEDLALPRLLADISRSVPASAFRIDISSTDLRRRGQQGQS